MTDCPEEQQTQHFRGQWFGYGPVISEEQVIFAVFASTARTRCGLTLESFDKKNLANLSQSLVRGSFVNRSLFDGEVAATPGKGVLVGISCADVSAIRELKADITLTDGPHKVRAICVLDRVDPGDLDGHATMGYSEALGAQLSQTQRGIKRSAVRMDLANVFDGIVSPDTYPWPRLWDVRLRRLISIIRVRGGNAS